MNIFKNEKTLPLSKYFQIVKPEYRIIEIVSHKSIRNYNSSNIAKYIASTYKAINRRVYREKKKLIIEANFKIGYCIDIQKGNAKFYFIVPSFCLDSIIEKINEIWSKATVTLLEGVLKPFSPEAEYFQLGYKREDALSLNVDRKTNDPLNSILSVMKTMQDDDRVMLFYNFIPCTQSNWLDRYNETMKKFKDRKSIDKARVSFEYMAKNVILLITKFVDDTLSVMFDMIGASLDKQVDSLQSTVWRVLEQQQDLSRTTLNKRKATVVDAQIAVISDSRDYGRRVSNALSVCQSFRSIDEDNELLYSRLKDKSNFNFFKANIGAEVSTFSSEECSNFIQIPARQLLNQFNINHIKTEEGVVPKKLQKGYFFLGENTCRGVNTNAFLEDDYSIGSYPLCIDGSQGSGKSTLMANIFWFALGRKEGGVLIDYIKNCEMANDVIKSIPKNNIIVLDYSKLECMQGFAFNEVVSAKGESAFERVRIANLQTMQFVELVNSVNEDSQTLQARMRKYLIAAGTIVFCTGETSLKAIIDCLEDHEKRASYINKLDKDLLPLLSDKIKMIRELDEYSKPTKGEPIPYVIGTKDTKIEGILDRVSLLKEDIALEYMFNKGSEGNIDFAQELEKGKIIIIKMAQDEWSERSKDVIVTFLVSKIWLSAEQRGKWNLRPRRCHIVIDEVFQCPTAMRMLSKKNILPQTRKFGYKFIFSVQGLQQLGKLLPSLVDAGCTFMLLRGIKEEDFNLLKSKIEGFEYEDIRDMAKTYKYPAFNLVNYSEGYSSFITKLPPPITSKKINTEVAISKKDI